jgi:hypothetical protein
MHLDPFGFEWHVKGLSQFYIDSPELKPATGGIELRIIRQLETTPTTTIKPLLSMGIKERLY